MDPRRNKEWLENAYQTKSMQEIANEIGVSYPTINRDFKKFGIPVRSRQEWLELRPDTYTNCLKENWSKSEYREKMSKSFKDRWDDPDYREKMGKIAQEKWDDSEYRKKMDRIYNSVEFKKKISRTTKKALASPEIRDKIIYINSTPEKRRKASENSKKLFQDPAHLEKMRKIWHSDEYRDKQSRNSSVLWQDKEFLQKMANVPKVSNLQEKFYSILDDLGILYYREYNDGPDDPEVKFGKWSCDCVIPRENQRDLIIEIQGPLHDKFEKVKTRDQQKFSYITKYCSHQYELKYLWYHEFGNHNRIIDTIKYWMGLTQVELTYFNFSDLEIRTPCNSEIKSLLGKYHYLSKPRGGINYGAYLGDKLIAVCLFSPLNRQNLHYQFNLEAKQIRELSRFCIHPRYQKKNFGSWMISRCIKKLKEKCPKLRLVISYCDKTYNHDGALYRASNFIQDGVVSPDYWYFNPITGWVMKKKKLYNHARSAGMTEKEFANLKGFIKILGKEKLRFIYKL